MPPSEFERSVFVNCPFDDDYDHILQAILFCLIRFGLTPRIAKERSDSGENRLEKILEMIQASRFSIHDLSRSQASEAGEHYRLNMPFELGLDLGCRRFGRDPLPRKAILILETKRFGYQKAISDLAGSDVQAHNGNFQIAVRKVRNWLAEIGGFEQVGASGVLAEYEDFQEWRYEKLLAAEFSEKDIQDYSTAELLEEMYQWTDVGRPRS